MITRSSIDQVFEKLQEDHENCLCVDCNCPSPVFASISHGSFICSLCAGGHDSLGNLSELKSLLSNDWTMFELKKMISGGNSALKEFTDYYGISEFPIEIKYKTNAMGLYRRMLVEITLGHTFAEELLTVEEGKRTGEEEKKGWFGGFMSKTKNIGNLALSQIDEITKKTGIKDGADLIMKEMKIGEIRNKTSTALDSISEKLKNNYDKSRETMQKITTTTVSLFHNIEETIETGITKAKNLVSNNP